MAVDAFIWFVPETGGSQIPGETVDRSFAANNAIQILGYSWSAENTLSIGSAGGGAGSGKAKLNAFKFQAPIGKHSPVLFKYLATGAHFKSATLALRTRNGTPFWQLDLGLVFVTGESQLLEAKDELAVEEWTLMYGSVKETYSFGGTNGVPGTISQGWNQVTNSESQTIP